MFRFAVGVMAILGTVKIGLVSLTAHVQREGRDYRYVVTALERLKFGPDDVIVMTGQAWLALRPRTGATQLHHLIDANVPDAFISSSKILFSDRLGDRLRYAVILDGMVDTVRESYPLIDRMFASGELKLAFEVKPPFQDLPWARSSPYHLLVFEKVRP
jgi:hypothetical protein